EQKKAIFADKQALIMVVDDSRITDIALGQYGYFTQEEFLNYAFNAIREDDGTNDNYNEQLGLVGSGITNGVADPENGIDITKFIGPDSKKFTWYPNDEAYVKTQAGSFLHRPYLTGNFTLVPDLANGGFMTAPDGTPIQVPLADIDQEKGLKLDVKIILQKKSGISYSCLEPGFYYTNALTKYMLEDSRESQIVKDIQANGKGYLDSLPYFFYYTSYDNVDGNTVMTEKTGTSAIYEGGSFMHLMASGLSSTGTKDLLRVTATYMGGGKLPSAIYIYPTDFDAKNKVCDYLDEWNQMCENGTLYCMSVTDEATGVVSETMFELDTGMKITYTDAVGMIINMINTMIQMITIALVAFTALSLVVSTVMIGIITYVSVVERVKEIGILRAVGARKKDIKRLFNAETFIIGLVAGVFGILVTYLISLVINVIVVALAGIWGIAALPWWQAIIMVVISVGLTLISGLIPAAAAAKKDPVVALRTE
ncbi:MAG: ABC transporter permease, partial [Clostridia bacterium]|nr:ABC transporter permease [Clostridia bacterium]